MSSSIPLYTTTLPIQINIDSGTGLLTSTHYPDVKLKKRLTIYIGFKNDDFPVKGPTLPDLLRPNTTFELATISSTCYTQAGCTIVSGRRCNRTTIFYFGTQEQSVTVDLIRPY